MENLALHIEYLLLRHDCIVVPGFGAFLNIRIPAKLDPARGRWLPMSSEVRFNASINNDDALLINSYSRKYSISFQEARELLDREVASLRYHLDKEGEATLGNLGIIRKNEHSIEYIPFSSHSKLSKDLGYFPVIDKAGNKTNEVSVQGETNTATTTLPPDEVGAEFNRDSRYYYFRVNKIAVKLTASVLLLLVAAISIFIPSERRTIEDQASVLPIDSIKHTNTDNISSDPSLLVEKESGMASEIISEDENAVDLTQAQFSAEGKRYFLIVGTFRSEAEADRFVEINSKDGYDLEIIPSKTLYRVSAKASADKTNLIKELNSSEFRNLFPEAWIWKN